MKFQEGTEMLDASVRLLGVYSLCDECLGRQFAWLGTNVTNSERGHSIKLFVTMMADEKLRTTHSEDGKQLISILAGNGMFEPARLLAEKYSIEYLLRGQCDLCTIAGKSLFHQLPEIAQMAVDNLQDIEFSSFLVGCVPSPALAEKEEELRAVQGLIHGETLKSNFNRELGKLLGRMLKREVEFEKPDVVVIYDMITGSVGIEINPVFIYGRYRKLVRGMPQSRWDCQTCHGKGCDLCKGTGRLYPDSVAEYVGEPMKEAARASGYKFHAAGREDIDAVMLGSGRPFVVEISRPRTRRLDLTKLADEVNRRAMGKVEVEGLDYTDRARGQELKEKSSENVKEYTALIETESEVTESNLKGAQDRLQDIVIEQRTPNRVAHRRSDRIRKKRVHEVRLAPIDSHHLSGFFRVQGGTYVKELISGDDGRTRPSIAELLNTGCKCVELSVVAVSEAETDHNA